MLNRTFTMEDQKSFALISGDYNPLHLDEIASRRSMFGRPIVHGMHTALWALNNWAENLAHPIELISLSIYFKRGLAVGDEVFYTLIKEKDYSIEIKLWNNESVYVLLNAEWKATSNKENHSFKCLPKNEECITLTSESIQTVNGEMEIGCESERTVKLFPHLTKRFPLPQIASLLNTTRLVGMKCPGVNSIYNKLDVRFHHLPSEKQTFKYKVTNFDERFSRTFIEIETPVMAGIIISSLRPTPRSQEDFSEMKKLMNPNELKGQRALVIGGSRGLGEVASKLLSAGNAKVLLTYFQGKNDADLLVQEINSGGGDASHEIFNVLSPETMSLDKIIAFSPTHLYYFATPRIGKSDGAFSAKTFETFFNYYVLSFAKTLRCLLPHALSLQHIFYPSSTFVEEKPSGFAEYISAKSTGENLCSDLEKLHTNIRIYKPRLPQMATDQTLSLMTFDEKTNPTPVILKYLRHFQQFQTETAHKK